MVLYNLKLQLSWVIASVSNDGIPWTHDFGLRSFISTNRSRPRYDKKLPRTSSANLELVVVPMTGISGQSFDPNANDSHLAKKIWKEGGGSF